MNARRILYPGIAAIGIVALGAYGYYAQRTPQGPHESMAGSGVAAASAKPANGGGGVGGAPATVDVVKVAAATLRDDINAAGTLRSNEA
ncbi:MAG: hypothetical protein V7642_811, partial [Burkholderiales bacterium]